MGDAAPFSEAENHLWTDHEVPCWHCEQPTKWVELAFEAPLHPGACTQAKYAELAEADRKADEAVDREWEKAGGCSECGAPRGHTSECLRDVREIAAELAEADRQAAKEQTQRDAAEAFEANPRPGDRKTENGQVMVWTGIAWRHVPKSELEDEAWRRR